MKTLMLALLISSNAMAFEYSSPNKTGRSCPSPSAIQRALKSAEQWQAVRPACTEADLELQAEILNLHSFLAQAVRNRCVDSSPQEPVREAARDLVKRATQIHNCRQN